MPGRKSFAGRSKRDNQSEDSDLSSELDYVSSNVNELSKPSKASSRQKDAAGEERVKCRFCLKVKSKKRTLKKHVERHHKEFYEKHKDKRRSYFVAD